MLRSLAVCFAPWRRHGRLAALPDRSSALNAVPQDVPVWQGLPNGPGVYGCGPYIAPHPP